MPRISSLSLSADSNADTASLETSLVRGDITSRLWMSVPRIHEQHLGTDRYDPFVIAVVPYAMADGEDIHVEGPVSADLLYNLNNHLIPWLADHDPAREAIRVIAAPLEDSGEPAAARGVATGISAGVDSLHLILNNTGEHAPVSLHLTHLIFNNVGTHGPGQYGRQVFEARIPLMRNIANAVGLPLITVDTNFHEAMPFDLGVTNHLQNLVPPMAFRGLFSKYLVAASHQYRDAEMGRAFIARTTNLVNLSLAEIAWISMLSTTSLRYFSVDGRHQRIQKLARIIDEPLSQEHLNVCINNPAHGGNCSRCVKCRRTLVMLDVLGKLPEFARVFDLDLYRKKRSAWLLQTIRRQAHDEYCREIIAIARKTGFRWPAGVFALGRLMDIFNRAAPRNSGGN